MMHALIDIGTVVAVGLFTVGPVVGWMLLLNARDRRREALLGTMWVLASRDLRPSIAIQVQVNVLSRRAIVAVDMRDCTRNQIWDAVVRWCAGLPPGVGLCVNGGFEPGLPAWLSYCLCTTTGGAAWEAASRASRARLRFTPHR